MSRLIAAFALLCSFAASAWAQGPQRSECLAMASAPRAVPVSFRLAANAEDVTITYAGHSTYYIDTPRGVRIATDFSGGYHAGGRLPGIVTMNPAHSTNYTLFPAPKTPHVLHGWGEDGKPAHVDLRLGDVYIRNVTTDIRRYYGDFSGGDMIRGGNAL